MFVSFSSQTEHDTGQHPVAGPNDVMDAGHKVSNCPSTYDPTITDKRSQRVPSWRISRRLLMPRLTAVLATAGSRFKKAITRTANRPPTRSLTTRVTRLLRSPSALLTVKTFCALRWLPFIGARSSNGAQLYMKCGQLNITGGTGTASPATYSIPGIYKSNDPGLLIDIYSMKTTSPYVIPGLPLFTCP
ncbi:hypothetical protein SMACR_12875 [Sordaria macrospora]|uniref:lytic cellulose monooxygenase (C4-dehydrogenating) n=1 Tax=Sordaria macrospora TaxID=5147 RepID=A0A8S8ZJW0_SORMA|nr:hypothetical protein SMACR_12875 [Sordaria macrospora]